MVVFVHPWYNRVVTDVGAQAANLAWVEYSSCFVVVQRRVTINVFKALVNMSLIFPTSFFFFSFVIIVMTDNNGMTAL